MPTYDGVSGNGRNASSLTSATRRQLVGSVAGAGTLGLLSQRVAAKHGDADRVQGRLKQVESNLSTLDMHLDVAANRGHDVEYERVTASTIENFVPFVRADLEHGRIDRARYVTGQLKRLYRETRDDLLGYLSGDRESTAAPRFTTSDIEIDGTSFVAETQIPGESGTERRRVFFNGYGGFQDNIDTIPEFHDFGANVVVQGIDPAGTIVRPTEGTTETDHDEFALDTDPIDEYVSMMDTAAENDVAVTVLIGIHDLPGWAFEEWPDLRADPARHHFEYTIDHPIARPMVETHLRAVVPRIEDHPAVHSVILSNEPSYDSANDQWTAKNWTAYLRERYESIESLNDVYDAEYDDFGAVPTGPNDAKAQPRTYDWTQFNQQRFADYHAWAADIIRDEASDLHLHTKFSGDSWKGPEGRRQTLIAEGIDPELFARFSDVNGFDNTNMWPNRGEPRDFLNWMSYYDLLQSFDEAPAFNSEDHLIKPGRRYSPEAAKHVRTNLWQGAIHGGSAHSLWLWRRTFDNSRFKNAANSVATRPTVTATIGHTTLDMNRLAEEITAFQEEDPRVAILYSKPAYVYAQDHLTVRRKTYQAISTNGVDVGFVSENQAQNGGLEDYDVLVLPRVPNVQRETIPPMYEYASGADSGTVLTVGEASLRADARDQPFTGEGGRQAAAILDLARNVSADLEKPALKDAFVPVLSEHGLMDVRVYDTETGELTEDLEWRATTHDGRLLVNVANYTRESRRVRIEVGGSTFTPERELLSDSAAEESVQTIPKLTPRLYAGDPAN
jgi:hypothetical protein